MEQVRAGNHLASVRLVKVGAQKDGTPKVSVCWDVGQKDGAWQDLTLKDSATKFLDWQLTVLGVKEKCNLAALDLNVRAESIAKAIGELKRPQHEESQRFSIEVSYRPFNGKDYMSVAVKGKIENHAPSANQEKSIGSIDTSEKLPF